MVADAAVQNQVAGTPGAEVNPSRHERIIVRQKRFVTVSVEHRPWNDDAGIAPHGHGRLRAGGARRDIREVAVRTLAVVHVHHPFGEEGGHVGVPRGGGREHLRVALSLIHI